MLSRQQVFSVPLAGPARRPEVRMLERSERKGHTSFGVAGCPIVRPFPNVNYEEPSNYLGLMRSGGLKTLKNKLGEYVRLAAGGAILISDRPRRRRTHSATRPWRALAVRRRSRRGDPRRRPHPAARSRCGPTRARPDRSARLSPGYRCYLWVLIS